MSVTFTVPSNWNNETAVIETTGYQIAYGVTADGRWIRLAEEEKTCGKAFYFPAGIEFERVEFVGAGGGTGAGGGSGGPCEIVSGVGGCGGSTGGIDGQPGFGGAGGAGGRTSDGRPSGGDGGRKASLESRGAES